MQSNKTFNYLIFTNLCVLDECMLWDGTHVKLIGQCAPSKNKSSLLSLCEFHGLNSACQAWQQLPI